MSYALAEVALISGSTAIAGPLLLSYLHARQAIAREQRLFKRQDEVASRVAEVATKADQVARLAASSAADTKIQLNQIHILVNSDMTAARQAELDQTQKARYTLMRLIEKDRSHGEAVSPADLAEVTWYDVRIAELEAILADRLAQFQLSQRAGGAGGG